MLWVVAMSSSRKHFALVVALVSVARTVASSAALRGSAREPDLPANASQLLALNLSSGVARHSWHCNCEFPFDVCSFTTCYRSSSCGRRLEFAEGGHAAEAGNIMPNATAPSVEVAVGVGRSNWDCNCAGTYSFCTITTCYASCR